MAILRSIWKWSTKLSAGFGVLSPPSHRKNCMLFPSASQPSRTKSWWCSTASTSKTALFIAVDRPDVDSMSAKEMKTELESYGVSTRTMLEKADFAKALKQARYDGLKPVDTNEMKGDTNDDTISSTTNRDGDGASPETATKVESTESRKDRYQKAMDEAKTMKVGDLKKELNSRGVATGSFIEKSEFVKAYAEAIADNIPKSSSKSSSSSSSSSPKSQSRSSANNKKDSSTMLNSQAVPLALLSNSSNQ